MPVRASSGPPRRLRCPTLATRWLRDRRESQHLPGTRPFRQILPHTAEHGEPFPGDVDSPAARGSRTPVRCGRRTPEGQAHCDRFWACRGAGDERRPGPAASRVLVIIPAYNEEASLPRVLEELTTTVPAADVVVVSDGSLDRTARRAALRRRGRRAPLQPRDRRCAPDRVQVRGPPWLHARRAVRCRWPARPRRDHCAGTRSRCRGRPGDRQPLRRGRRGVVPSRSLPPGRDEGARGSSAR